MRFKLLFFTLLCSLAAILPAKAETLTVYDGTTTNNRVPAYMFYWDDFTRSECVIPSTALESMTGSTITAIKFYTNSDNVPYTSVASAYMYMTEVDYTSISNYVTRANATIVYTGTLEIVSANGGGEVTITFDTPYTYGGGNLVIGTENISDAGYKNIKFYGQTVSGASIAGSNASASGTIPVENQNFIPKTTFTYTPSSGPVYYSPKNLNVSNIGTNEATATWTPGGDETSWNVEYKKSSDASWTSAGAVSTPTIVLDALANGMNYEVRVQGNYGSGNLSNWATASFTTLMCDPEDMGEITYHLEDSYGDGWNNAAIQILDPNGNIVETLTILHPSSSNTDNLAEGTVSLCYNVEYTFRWVTGSFNSECSFVITDPDGEVIYEVAKGSAPSSSQNLTTYTLLRPSSCVKPTNLTASNVVYNGATLTWTPGDAEQDAWEVVYGAAGFNPDEATPVAVSGEATYTITGLTENTAYTAYVRGNCGTDGKSQWSAPVTFTTPERYAKPTDLAVNDITAHTANTSWNGDADSYNLRYRKVLGYSQTFFESFEGSFPGSWTIIDSDGDGNNWQQVNPASTFNNSTLPYYDGTYAVMSRSYNGNDLTPDQWLISPQVDLGGVLKYYILDDGSNWQETYRIYVSTTGTNIADFSPVTEDLLSPNTSEWVEQTADLSAFEGQQGYIAFRHYNCTGMDFMFIDAVSINAMTYGDWVEVNDVTSPYTITGLDAETDYVVQVQGVYDEGNSNWTNSVLFTTATADAMPIDLAVTDVTDTEATATWVGSQDSYNLRYRNVDLFEDFSNGMPSGWTTINNDGDNYTWSKQQFEPSCISSASFINNVGALTPDNWLITPKVNLKGQLTFDAWGQDLSDFAEVFKVYVSTSGTNITDFVEISQDITTTHDQTTYSFDLSQYAGQEGYIAIRHYNCTNMYWLNVTNFSIGSNWTTINDVTSPYTIEGLTPETTYEVQVQGILDNGTTNWTESVIFTTLEMQAIEASLAYIETFGQGICGDLYTITDQLIAIDYNDGYNNDVYLWCKDQGNASVYATQPNAGQIDFMQQQGAQSGAWDQSNWVVLKLSGENAHSLAQSAKGHYLTGVTGIYDDDNNYMIEVIDNNFTISEETATYTPNVYCTANFINSNLTFDEDSEGAFTDGDTETSYYFMNPKIQEYCTITWAQWDADKGYFVAPDNTGFDGAFNVSWDFNALGSIGGTLVDGKVYEFNAIVQLAPIKNSTTPDQTYIVYPMDLSSQSIITAINSVNVNGEVVGVEYVNSLGMTSKTPFQGVNIVVTHYSNGTTSTMKKIFK